MLGRTLVQPLAKICHFAGRSADSVDPLCLHAVLFNCLAAFLHDKRNFDIIPRHLFREIYAKCRSALLVSPIHTVRRNVDDRFVAMVLR